MADIARHIPSHRSSSVEYKITCFKILGGGGQQINYETELDDMHLL